MDKSASDQSESSRLPAAKSVTVVLPAFKERENLGPLIAELAEVDKRGYIKRVIVVDDDSPDGTSDYIKTTAFPLPVDCLLRVGRQGLTSAIIEGALLADSPLVAVMDADGQHAPKDLIAMIERQAQSNANLVIGSRFKTVKPQETHRGLRRNLSNLGNRLALGLVRRQLTDPLTGFFLIERPLFLSVARSVRGKGFKVLLDILFHLRAQNVTVEEEQIEFRPRRSGTSKLDFSVALEFLDQLVSRYTKGLIPEKFSGFALIGGLGVVVHFAFLSLFLFSFSIAFPVAQSAATAIAILSNYALNNLFSFRRNRRHGFGWLRGLLLFYLVCGTGAVANVGVATLMNESDFTWWLSAVAGVVVGTVFNFSLSRFYVWR